MKLGQWVLGGIALALALPAGAASFTYSDLVSLIREKNVTSVETLLPQLPQELRSHYVLMHTSESLQAASYENPRVILFGEDAQLTCTFNGDPEHAGYDTIECFQFHKAQRRFEFRQIEFPKNAPVKFSELNRSTDGRVSCTSCHGADPRPNWNDYDSWPGVYGEGDDKPDHEKQQRFITGMGQHPRYKWLDSKLLTKERPNLNFSDYVGRMNALRVHRILKNKVNRRELLGFAVSGLQCKLAPDQRAKLDEKGTDYIDALSLAKSFQKVGLSVHEWTLRNFGHDQPQHGRPKYEHQSGYSFLTIGVGMAMAQELAEAGNTLLRSGIERIVENTPMHRSGDPSFVRANAILPDPDYFGSFAENTQYLCPEMTRLFVDSYDPH